MGQQVHQYIVHYHQWFYLITVAWTFFEGETFVLLAAAAAAQGIIDPYMLCISAWLGSWMGDQCWFFLGRHFGHLVLKRFPQSAGGIDKVHRLLEKWDVPFILTFRFIYGVRNFSSAAIGLSKLNAWRFVVLNFISAGIWSVTFVGVGYLFGHAIGRMMGKWANTIELVVLGLFVVGIGVGWYVSRRSQRRARAARAAADALDVGDEPHEPEPGMPETEIRLRKSGE
jgi:membrane protein DedA with SNARE-associated domain